MAIILRIPIPSMLANVTNSDGIHPTIPLIPMIMTPVSPIKDTIQGNSVMINAFLGDFVACFTKS